MNILLRRCAYLFFIVYAAIARGQEYHVDTLARGPHIQLPSTIAFIPGGEGEFFIAERNTGRVFLYDGVVHPSPFLTVPVEDEGEQGLLGLAVHPAYPDSPYVYVYYVRASDRAGILDRYRDSSGVGVARQQFLFIARRDEAMINNGGTLRFGPDGDLYVAVGDHGFKPSNAQDTLGGRNLRGKILRLTSWGSVPDDNPFPGKLYWSIGLRDPRGMAFDPVTGRLFVMEGGPHDVNEIVEVPGGTNLGWPGHSTEPPDGKRRLLPLYVARNAEHLGLTGTAVYRGDAFPRLRGRILFVGNVEPRLWIGPHVEGPDSTSAVPWYRSNTGFADVKVGQDGCVYIVSGPYQGSRILKLSPLQPEFAGDPPLTATQGIAYRYTPMFRGTPPELELLSGPSGMTVDTTTWSVLWIPSNDQALTGLQQVVLRARNGAGSAVQRFTVQVQNVNDPPMTFATRHPSDEEEFRFLGEDPYVTFSWNPTNDPDGDSLHYVVHIDTTISFDSTSRMDVDAGGVDSIRVLMPSANHTYYWYVTADDGKLQTASSPGISRFSVLVSKLLVREKATHVESALEQNFPNPFNPATSIRYTLPRAGYVRLTVFNLLGQEVARLYDGVQQAGTYSFEFTKTDLPSGIYFYRLIAPGLSETRKMVIAK
jgi:glucose/arabinose dehydrogenase